MVSPNARIVYTICAAGSVILVAVFVTVLFALASAGAREFPDSFAIIFLLKALFLVCAVFTGVLWVGMCYFCFEFDHSPPSQKAIWFAALILLGPILAPLYFVLVYRRSSHFRAVPLHRAQAASNSAG